MTRIADKIAQDYSSYFLYIAEKKRDIRPEWCNI